jgi:hypothetical protein
VAEAIDKKWDLEGFLTSYPRMVLAPLTGVGITVEGTFDFTAESPPHEQITDSYELRLVIPSTFPKDAPVVYELGKRIPRNETYHVNSDGSLCLGSPLRLRMELAKRPTLPSFSSTCIIPYLYAISHKFKKGGGLLFGELAHGTKGEIDDYKSILGLTSAEQVDKALECLKLDKRQANKRPCPCGCGKRLGMCKFNRRLRALRELLDRQNSR